MNTNQTPEVLTPETPEVLTPDAPEVLTPKGSEGNRHERFIALIGQGHYETYTKQQKVDLENLKNAPKVISPLEKMTLKIRSVYPEIFKVNDTGDCKRVIPDTVQTSTVECMPYDITSDYTRDIGKLCSRVTLNRVLISVIQGRTTIHFSFQSLDNIHSRMDGAYNMHVSVTHREIDYGYGYGECIGIVKPQNVTCKVTFCEDNPWLVYQSLARIIRSFYDMTKQPPDRVREVNTKKELERKLTEKENMLSAMLALLTPAQREALGLTTK